MLKVVTGPFHPSLESAFVSEIQRIKDGDPWARIAVLVPSKPILDRLRRLLAIDHLLSLLNVHLLTFHQFALRLADERFQRSGNPVPRIVDDLFFEHLLRRLSQETLAGSTALAQLGHSYGTWPALWTTIRDLKDGGVDPDIALQALAEGCFGQEDRQWLEALFSLHGAVDEARARLGVGTADDLAEDMASAVPASPFVASLTRVLYYGFYDLTQMQLSLFQAVTASAPTTLFFPLSNDPSFAFARRFFERYVVPLAGAHTRVDLETVTRDAPAAEVSVQSVIGAEEELSSVCRAIIDLVETHGYRFDEIGVVTRTLAPYGAAERIFERHRIPLASQAGRPLIQQPLCKMLLLLASLPVGDFYRATVLDVITSPFYTASAGVTSPAYRPEQWKAIVEGLHITHGVAEWARLDQYCASALELDGADDEPGAIGPLKVAPEVIAVLRNAVSRLVTSYTAVPTKGTCASLCEAFARLVHAHVHAVHDGHEGHASVLSQADVWTAIDRALSTLADLDLVGGELSWAEFVELLTHACERETVGHERESGQGVMFLDAMSARGLSFRALFVIGLNEKVFPRYIREDAFLRDRHRRVLETTLGYKVDEKLPGYDEETLLFTLLSQAARRRLCLSFQRADERGRMLAPSPYLNRADLRAGIAGPSVDVIARRLSERIAQRPTTSRLLPSTDVAQWMAVTDQDPTDLLAATGREAAIFRQGREALARTEEEREMTPFDGMTGPLEAHWAGLADRGIAPTPLERYARCPFRYFSADVLKLTPVRVPASDEVDARVLGTFCHSALRRCYELLLPMGWPKEPVTDDTVDWCIETAVAETARDIERRHHTGHHLLWELAKASIVDVITAAVDEDTHAYHDAPFLPIAFELSAEGELADLPGNGRTPLKIRGRIDRLDRHQDTGALRVVDYKLKLGKAMTTEDRHLVQSAIRGYRLQPPLYGRLQIPDHGVPRQVQLLYLAPHWNTPVARSTFDVELWSGDAGTHIRNTLGRLVDGIKNGNFFIMPGTYCESCEYRIACRLEHPPTWWRTSRAAEFKDLARLRTLRIEQ